MRDEAEETTDKGKQNTSGLATGRGFGFQTAGLGVWAAYYGAVGENVFLTPYVGFGWIPVDGDWLSGPAFGGMFVIGNRHRFLMDLGWGLAGGVRPASMTLSDKPSVQASYGANFAIGYEYMNASGFFCRAELGTTQMTSDNWSGAGQSKTQPTLQLALGSKWF